MGQNFASIKNYFFGLKYLHKSSNLPDPTENQIVINMFEAAKRLCSKKIGKKEPLRINHIQQLFEIFIGNKEKMTLTSSRTFTMIILGFCGFLRFSELSNLRTCDIVFCSSYIKLFLEKTKTDIYRRGNWTYISAGETKCCPVATLKEYMKLAELQPESNENTFRAIQVFSKEKREKLRSKNIPISYTRARELIIDAVKQIGLPPEAFSLHSLRSGGAPAAASLKIEDRLFKQHGRWISESAKDDYVEANLRELLSFTKSFGF